MPIDDEISISPDLRKKDVEKRIVNIICKVKGNRNRPCFQNIFELLSRTPEYHSISKEEVKSLLSNMLLEGSIVNRGTEEKESYLTNIITVETENIQDEDTSEHVEDVEDTTGQVAVADDTSDHVADDTSDHVKGKVEDSEFNFYPKLTLYLEKFMDRVVTCIDERVVKEVNAKTAELMPPTPSARNKSFFRQLPQTPSQTNQRKSENDETVLIRNYEANQLSSLRDEIRALREELQQKDEQIKTLTNEKDSYKITSLYKTSVIEKNKSNNQSNKNNRNIMEVDTTKKQKRDVTHDSNSLKIRTSWPNNNNCANTTDWANDDNKDNDTEEWEKQRKPKVKSTKRSITIVGDSMIKNVQAYKLNKQLKNNEKIYVKSFPGATVEDMWDHVRPTMRRTPDLVVLHAGTNDLRDETADHIASSIMKLALEIKGDQNDVMVSSIIDRTDSEELYQKSVRVNEVLKLECSKYHLHFIDNSNIDGWTNLNGSGLHLNYKGTLALAKNFMESIKI